MTKTKKEPEAIIRQVILTGMNESVSVLSGYDKEDMDYLSEKAMMLFTKIKSKKEGNDKE